MRLERSTETGLSELAPCPRHEGNAHPFPANMLGTPPLQTATARLLSTAHTFQGLQGVAGLPPPQALQSTQVAAMGWDRKLRQNVLPAQLPISGNKKLGYQKY